jgi:hypothetical protein
MGQRDGAGEVDSDEMPRSGHADFQAQYFNKLANDF